MGKAGKMWYTDQQFMKGGSIMRLLFKQRFFSWLDSYDIYDEAGNVVFSVEGKLSWGHRLHILDARGVHIGTLQQKVLSFLPAFELYIEGEYVGCIRKEFTLFKPSFTIDCNDWQVDGELFEWDYTIYSPSQGHIATITKELFQWTDTYVIDVAERSNALGALLVALAIDAEKCSRN